MKTDRRPAGKFTVGYNSTMKLLKSGEAEKVLLAYDCSDFIKQNVLTAAAAAGAELVRQEAAAAAGSPCGGSDRD